MRGIRSVASSMWGPLRGGSLLLASLLVAGCAGMSASAGGGRPAGDPVASDLYRGDYSFVRKVTAEDGGPNEHPWSVTPVALRAALATLRVGSGKQDQPLFLDPELDEIAPPLARALAEVGPREDIGFAVTGYHGMFERLQGRQVTTGRLFVRDGKLQMVLGLVHGEFEQTLRGSGVLREFTLGSRRVSLDARGSAHGGAWRTVGEGRSDWVAVARAEVVAPELQHRPAADQPAMGAGVDQTTAKFAGRLRVLQNLRERGLISEEEYLDKRRAILDGL